MHDSCYIFLRAGQAEREADKRWNQIKTSKMIGLGAGGSSL